MKNANLPPTNNRPVLPATLHAQAIQELHELLKILAFVDSCLECIKQFLNDFANQPNETNTNDHESDDESVDTPLVSPFPHSDNDSDDGEVLNELIEYENVGMLRREKAINSFDGNDLAFECMIGFRKFFAYFDPFLPMNIITRIKRRRRDLSSDGVRDLVMASGRGQLKEDLESSMQRWRQNYNRAAIASAILIYTKPP
ncbi:hypothetical protein Tco_0503798 [Tanacetum coccineum]